MTAPRPLAIARCSKGHVLATVTSDGQRYFAHLHRVPVYRPRHAEERSEDRDQMPYVADYLAATAQTEDITDLAASMNGYPTCGCNDEYTVNLYELRRRAMSGDTRPIICQPVQL